MVANLQIPFTICTKDSDRYQRHLNLVRLQGSNSRGVSEAGACSIILFVHVCLKADDSVFFKVPLISRGSVISSHFQYSKSIRLRHQHPLGFWCPPNQRVLYAYTTLKYIRRPVLWRAATFISVVQADGNVMNETVACRVTESGLLQISGSPAHRDLTLRERPRT